MYVLGSPSSSVNVTIIDCTIATCSAVAQIALAVSVWHAAQQAGAGERNGIRARHERVHVRVRWGEGIVQTTYA